MKMIGKKMLFLIKLYKFKKKVKIWHQKFRIKKDNNSFDEKNKSNWIVVEQEKINYKVNSNYILSNSLSVECLDQIIQIIMSHPSEKTNEISKYVDEHIYVMF